MLWRVISARHYPEESQIFRFSQPSSLSYRYVGEWVSRQDFISHLNYRLPANISTDLPPEIDAMHELFLTAQLSNDDLQRALRILQGYCAMSPVNIVRRRITFEGPRTKNPKGIDPAFIARQSPPKAPLWRGLSEQLTRQSYFLILIYDIDRDQFNQAANGADTLNSATVKK